MYFVVINSKTTDNIKKVSQTVMGCNKNKVMEKYTILKTENDLHIECHQ